MKSKHILVASTLALVCGAAALAYSIYPTDDRGRSYRNEAALSYYKVKQLEAINSYEFQGCLHETHDIQGFITKRDVYYCKDVLEAAVEDAIGKLVVDIKEEYGCHED